MRLKKAKLPLNRMNFYISLMELGVESLKQPGAAKDATKDAAKLGLGIAKSILTMKLDQGVLDAGKNLASAGLREKRRQNADRVFRMIAYIDQWRRKLVAMLTLVVAKSKHEKGTASGGGEDEDKGGGEDQVEGEGNGESSGVDVSLELCQIKLTLCHLQQVSNLEPRWEVPAAYADLLGALLLVEDMSSLPQDFAAWLWTGEPADEDDAAGSTTSNTDLSKVTKGSRRLLDGLPCELTEVPVASTESVTGETMVTVMCMGDDKTKEVALKDTAALEDDFAGLQYLLKFGDPPSLKHRKENPVAEGTGSTLKLGALAEWGSGLSSSVVRTRQRVPKGLAQQWLRVAACGVCRSSDVHGRRASADACYVIRRCSTLALAAHLTHFRGS
jgi:hypothetical protein